LTARKYFSDISEQLMSNRLLAIDVGGTFTDFVSLDQISGAFTVWKTLTTQPEPIEGIIDGLKAFPNADLPTIRLGTTIVTNALLERKGAVVAYLTTKGFRDVPFMQRGHRRSHYDPTWIKANPFVERRHCFEIAERLNYQGDILLPLDEAELRKLALTLRGAGEVESVAICLLHSYASPVHEFKARQILAEELPDLTISVSFDVMPRWKEYERAATTIADAYVKPRVSRQIAGMRQRFAEKGWSNQISVIKSNGGEMTLEGAMDTPIHLAVSGPTGGVIAAKHLAKLKKLDRLVTLDMGGTSTDCATVINYQEVFTTDFEVEFGLPIQLPMIDIRSIGAGGGSVAWIDKGGMLRVGPQSAGAQPGPACYGKGGIEATVTDANIVLGRLSPDDFALSGLQIDASAARAVIEPLASELGRTLPGTALAIIQIANNNMVGLLRSVLTERGLDPREFALLAFGGAGPLHAGELLRAFEIGEALVPIYPAEFSAFGFILSDARVDRHRTVQLLSIHFDGTRATRVLQELTDSSLAELKRQGYSGRTDISRTMEARYVGQNYELELPLYEDRFEENRLAFLWESFHEIHARRFGFSMPGEAIEIVNFKVVATLRGEKPALPEISPATEAPLSSASRPVYFDGEDVETPILERKELRPWHQLDGPLLIREPGSMTIICPGQRVTVDSIGNLEIREACRV
jgi:N-methylhydantoinase A